MKAIILHNMGGARNENELKEFLYNMFKDKRIISSPLRHILAPIIANTRYKKVWKNYEKIGGSKIYEITQNLVSKMQKYTDYEVTYVMRYTKPFLKDIIHKYNEIILLPMYPHYSFTTYESAIDDLKKSNFKGKVSIVKPFFKENEFNKIIVENILKEIKNPKEYNLIFSAHGIPKKLIQKGDKYYSHIKKHIEILSTMVEFKSINLAFQSRFGKSEWLKPYLEDTLKQFKNENVVIYPLSFMIDNSETDLELSIEYRNIAKEIGINKYKVIKCPNDDEKIAKFLVRIANESRNPKS